MNQFSKYIMVAGVYMTLLSCGKQLSEPPANVRIDGTVITDQKSAVIALNGAYYRFANVTSDNITDWTYHQVSGASYAGNLSYGFGLQPDDLNLNADAGYPQYIWPQNYLLITAANGVIDGIANVAENAFTGDRKKQIIGESRFLRAYGHFNLLMYLSEWFRHDSKNGVLIRDKFTTFSEIQKMRSSVAESYAFILADLDYAIANAPVTNAKYYVTKWAAMALKMRVLMTRGEQPDLEEVKLLGNKLIQTSGFALENNLKDIFYTKGLSSNEVILGVQPQPNQEVFYYILSRAYYPAASTLFVATKKLKDMFPSDDPRGGWMIGPESRYQVYSPDTYYFGKYIAAGGTPSQLTETSYAIRMSEVYLMMAEATIRSNGNLNEAKTLIKTVMSKGGVTNFSAVDNANTADELLLQNYYEVSRNLTGEDGIEWFTLMRLPIDRVRQIRPTILSSTQFYFPVPRVELDANPLFGEQNTGYGR